MIEFIEFFQQQIRNLNNNIVVACRGDLSNCLGDFQPFHDRYELPLTDLFPLVFILTALF